LIAAVRRPTPAWSALVHEAYFRLVNGKQDQHWDGRGHFFAAAEAMWRILLNRARDKKRLKRGGSAPLAGAALRTRPPRHCRVRRRTWLRFGSRLQGIIR
jgi:hypothetical protein